MILNRLDLTNFRNFSRCSLSLSPTLNVFIGKNGSGKSSLIESVYLLGFGRSFRTSKLNSIIRHENDAFSLFAKSKSMLAEQRDIAVGLSRDRNGDFVCQINGDRGHRLSDLVSLFPIQLFTPQSTELIIGSPKDRRKFLDWGVFHVEHSFGRTSRDYNIVLKQRNALLKRGFAAHTEIEAWDSKLVDLGEMLTSYRSSYLSKFSDVFTEVLSEFLPEFKIQIEYNRGWTKEKSLEESLKQKLQYDSLYGSTSVGPHKADLRFKIDNYDASEVLSRGQLRMTVAALQLAQTISFNRQTQSTSIFLLDDLGAELDENKRELFLDKLVKTDAQVIVSAIDQDQLSFTKKYDNKKMFHVEHGNVSEE